MQLMSYDYKYGVRSIQGGGRSSDRETIGIVAARAFAKKILRLRSEIERNDMVEYFGQRADVWFFLFSQCVGAIIWFSLCEATHYLCDVNRPQPMNVLWSIAVQSMTKRPMKGMLNGSVTILNWYFVKNDWHRFETCYQIALAMKDEVDNLEKAGIAVIQRGFGL